MHVHSFVVAAAVTTSTPVRAAARRASSNADASVPGATESSSADRAAALHECNAATANGRKFSWVSGSLACIAAAWRRRFT